MKKTEKKKKETQLWTKHYPNHLGCSGEYK